MLGYIRDNPALDSLEPIVRFDEMIDAVSAVAMLRQIEQADSQAQRIPIICDNARYDRAMAVSAYLQTSRIGLVFLSAYAPYLNLIEWFWKSLQEASPQQPLL